MLIKWALKSYIYLFYFLLKTKELSCQTKIFQCLLNVCTISCEIHSELLSWMVGCLNAGEPMSYAASHWGPRLKSLR